MMLCEEFVDNVHDSALSKSICLGVPGGKHGIAHGGLPVRHFTRSSVPLRLNEGSMKPTTSLTLGQRRTRYTRQRERKMTLSPNVRTVGGNDESGRITCHHLEFTILCRSLLYHPTHLIPSDFLAQSRYDVLLFYRRARPGAVPRRSRRERQDRRQSAWRHAKQPTTTLEFKIYPCVQSPSISLQNHRFRVCLPRSKESLSSPLVLEASSSTSPISPTDPADDANSVDFVARVSTIPLVNTALRAYEQTKASSRVVKVRFSSRLPSTIFSTAPDAFSSHFCV